MTGFITSMKDTFPFIPDIATTDYFLYCIHPWLLPLVMLVVAFTGWGRIFEGKNGSVHKGNFLNQIPDELVKSGVKIVTPAGTEAGFIHFHVNGWESVELCKLLNEKKFMVRPVPKQHAPAPVRISTGFYLTESELDSFADTLKEIIGN